MEKLYTKCIFDLLNRRKPSCVENVDPATTLGAAGERYSRCYYCGREFSGSAGH